VIETPRAAAVQTWPVDQAGTPSPRVTLRSAVRGDAILFVHPDYAGLGIGRTLLAAAHDTLRTAGCREAFLFVHERNERALAVYTAAGYRPDESDRVSDFRGTRIREVRLVKRL
jgi:GNAT superfamily N-acetyltransferase